MQITELSLAIFVSGLLAVGAGQYYGRAQDKAALTSDLQTVSAIALEYASNHCTVSRTLSLADAQTALGTSANVTSGNEWVIAVTPRPVSGHLGSGGAVTSIRYVTQPGTWQSQYFLAAHHGESTPTHVSIRVRHQSESPNRQSFRRLLEFGLC